MKAVFLLIFLGLSWTMTTDPGKDRPDYVSEFGKDWVNAESILFLHEEVFHNLADSFSVPYNEIIPIIFPELIRYSALQNKIEVSLLKTLYVYKGKDYADFSIGIFQMKPSFAEQIRNLSYQSNNPSLRKLFDNDFDSEKEDHRKQLVTELNNPVTEFKYLIAFFKIANQIYHGKHWNSVDEKVRHFATLYNCGVQHSEGYIREMSRQKYFSTTVFGPYYCYADIASYYFNKSNHQTILELMQE